MVPQPKAAGRWNSYVSMFQVRKLGPERGSHLSKVTQLKTTETKFTLTPDSKACAFDLHSDPEFIFETQCWESPEQAERETKAQREVIEGHWQRWDGLILKRGPYLLYRPGEQTDGSSSLAQPCACLLPRHNHTPPLNGGLPADSDNDSSLHVPTSLSWWQPAACLPDSQAQESANSFQVIWKVSPLLCTHSLQVLDTCHYITVGYHDP